MKMKSLIAALLMAGAGTLAMAQKVKSPKEAEAVNAVLTAATPDQKIAAADNLLSKYKDTAFKSIALQMAGEAYAQKGDAPNAIVYGDRAIEADPKNFQALLLVSSQLARMTKEFDLDKDEKLKRATKLANDAIGAIGTAEKPNPQLTDDQWAGIKKDLTSEAHETLGMIATVDKKWAAAITEYKAAIDTSSSPAYTAMVRLMSVYNNDKKYDDASALADKVIAAGAPDNLKKIAQEEKARAAKGKGQ
jgi:tetratricopeptide (TPR) repeat protein